LENIYQPGLPGAESASMSAFQSGPVSNSENFLSSQNTVQRLNDIKQAIGSKILQILYVVQLWDSSNS